MFKHIQRRKPPGLTPPVHEGVETKRRKTVKTSSPDSRQTRAAASVVAFMIAMLLPAFFLPASAREDATNSVHYLKKLTNPPQMSDSRAQHAWRLYADYMKTREDLRRCRKNIGSLKSYLASYSMGGPIAGGIALTQEKEKIAELKRERANEKQYLTRLERLKHAWDKNNFDMKVGKLEQIKKTFPVKYPDHRSSADLPIEAEIKMNRIEWRLRQFYSSDGDNEPMGRPQPPTTPATPTPPTTPTTESNSSSCGGIFPQKPFNHMQINYSFSGGQCGKINDTDGFTTARRISGALGTGTMSLSGSATKNTKNYGAKVKVVLWAGDKRKEIEKEFKGSFNFNLQLEIPKDAKSGGFSIHMTGYYSTGNCGMTRGLLVLGEFSK